MSTKSRINRAVFLGSCLCMLLNIVGAGSAAAQDSPKAPEYERTAPTITTLSDGRQIYADSGSERGDPDPDRRRRRNEHNQFFAYGNEMLLKGKLDEALRVFLQAREIYPEQIFIDPCLGEVYMRKGMWREAEAAYQKYLKRMYHPGSYSSGGYLELARYGLVELHLGNLPEAYKAYEKAREKHERAKPNLPVLVPSEQTRMLEACLRFLMAGEGMGITREEQAAELKKVLALSPHLLLAEYEYVQVVLWKQYEKDRAGYLKAARPYLEEIARYAVGDLQKEAQSRMHGLYGTPLKTEPKP